MNRFSHTEYGTMATNGEESKVSEQNPEHLSLVEDLIREVHNKSPGGVHDCLKALVGAFSRKPILEESPPLKEPVVTTTVSLADPEDL